MSLNNRQTQFAPAWFLSLSKTTLADMAFNLAMQIAGDDPDAALARCQEEVELVGNPGDKRTIAKAVRQVAVPAPGPITAPDGRLF